MITTVVGAMLLLTLALPPAFQQGDQWGHFRNFEGEWQGHETGKSGIGKGTRSYRFLMGGLYLFGENTSRFEPQEKNPEGEVHHDWTFFSFDRMRKVLVIRQFHSEGFVNRLVHVPAAGTSVKYVFVSEASENAPPGLMVRLTYEFKSKDSFVEIFELALPGEDFEVFLTNRWKRLQGNS